DPAAFMLGRPKIFDRVATVALERVPYSAMTPGAHYLTGEHGLTDEQARMVGDCMDWDTATRLGYGTFPPAYAAPTGPGDIIASNQYGLYAIPRSSAHRPAARTIASGRVHEPETIEFICN